MTKRAFIEQQRESREHDDWVRDEITQASAKANDPSIKLIPRERVRDGWQRAEFARLAADQSPHRLTADDTST